LARVPAQVRMHQKRLLFEAARRFVPPELLADLETRGKRTFTFPLAHWISRYMRPMVEETFSPSRLASTGVLQPGAMRTLWRRYGQSPTHVGWSRIWDLFVLQRWCELMDVCP